MTYCTYLMELLSKQSPLYQPGVFWQEASKVMIEEINQQGIESFRRLPSSLNFLYQHIVTQVMPYQKTLWTRKRLG